MISKKIFRIIYNNQENTLTDTPFGDIYIPSHLEKKRNTVLLFSQEMSLTGAPLALLNLAKVLKEKEYFVCILAFEEGPIKQAFLDESIPVIIDKSLKKYVFETNEFENKKLVKLVKSFSFAIFNTLVLANFIKLFIGTRKKIVWWIHEGTTIANIPELRIVLPKSLSDNIDVRFVSDYSYNVLKNNGFEYKAKILPYGIDTIRLNEEKNENSKYKFVCIGTFNERKNQKLLIDSIESMPACYNVQAEYYFVGTATDSFGESQLNRLKILMNNNNNIFYFDSLSHQEVLKLINDCDALIIPSKDDPLPTVATESLMLNRLVICSKNTGTASFIIDDQSGIIIDIDDEQSIMNVVKKILDNKEYYSKISKNGFSIFEKNFSKKVFLKNVNSLIEKTK